MTPPDLDPAVRPTTTIEEAARLFGIGRSSAYSAAANGDIRTIRLGHRLLVPTAWLRRVLELDADGGDPDAA